MKFSDLAIKRMDYFVILCYTYGMFNKGMFNKKEVVAVALSGGADSVCLLHLLYTNAKALDITVKAINVEHGIRGENSLKDSAFVKELCLKLNVPLKTYSVNVPKLVEETGYSEEHAGRILRYECFDNALIEGFCDKIATAHHANDNAETVLFNLFRGSALSGVCGISEHGINDKIIRPLLNCTRQQINDYVIKNNLPFTQDESNFSNRYSRNYIRQEILPKIEERFNGATDAINRFSNLARQDDNLLCELAKKLIKGNSVEFTDELHFPLFSRACLCIMQNLGINKDFESAHVNAVYNLKNCQTGKRVNLKNGVTAYKSGNLAVFEKEIEREDFCIDITLPFEYETPFYTVKIERVKEVNGKGLYFDGDKIPQNAVLRTRRTGDEIITFGGNKKTLKKFFTDKKIDARISKNLPIIAVENKIYAICGVDISKLVKLDEKSTKIYKITCIKKGD